MPRQAVFFTPFLLLRFPSRMILRDFGGGTTRRAAMSVSASAVFLLLLWMSATSAGE